MFLNVSFKKKVMNMVKALKTLRCNPKRTQNAGKDLYTDDQNFLILST